MQRSIMSFFSPSKEGQTKPQKETSGGGRQGPPPDKAARKERRGVVAESDSPVKRPGRKATQVLSSEGEEEDEALTPPRGQKPAPESPQDSPPSSTTSPENTPSPCDTSPASLPASGIPKRITARKQLPKRKIEDVLERQDADEECCAKKRKEVAEPEIPRERPIKTEVTEDTEEGEQPVTPPEPCGEAPADSGTKAAVAVKEEPQEDQARPPARAPRTLSSFFAPRKPAVKTEVKQEESGAAVKREESGAAVKREESGAAVKQEASGLLDPSSYNPAKNNYHPVEDACWKPGQKVPYLAVARTFEKIEEVSARLRMVETLSNLLRSVVALSPPDLLPILYLSLNRLGPPQQGLELGVGDGILLKAVAQATGRQLDVVKAEAAEVGDVGLVAENSRVTQRFMVPPPPLTAAGVFAKFKEIAQLTGNASTNKKMDIIRGLFVACRHSEARFIARSLRGRLRLGLAEQSVLTALTQAVSLTPPGQGFPPAVVDAGKGKSAEARKAWLEEQGMILKQTFCEVPDFDRIVPVLLEHGLEKLPEHCRLSPGTPLKPMLAHPTHDISEVLKRFEEAAFTCEYKYDGQRAQIHALEGGEVKIFSRNQEDNTGKYPDIISRIPKIKLPSVTSFILDTEAVAWDREKKQIRPFQVLTTRKRKDVDPSEIQVQVCLYAFDLIYLNGQSLVREPLSRRRQLLRENFVETEGEFLFATSLDSKDLEQIAEFLEQSVKDSCEGLMVKTLEVDATYEIAKRSHNWLKLKKDYLDGVGDTLDLVVIGAYLGRGKRAGRYGGFLLASYDEDTEELHAICKLGTGFSDEELEEQYQHLQALVLPGPRPYVRAGGAAAPDHWLDPVTVWEVKCADLSLSPIYPAARTLVDDEKGISLRFPRFVRVRRDKRPEDATTSDEVAEMYQRQSQIQNQLDSDSSSDMDDFF